MSYTKHTLLLFSCLFFLACNQPAANTENNNDNPELPRKDTLKTPEIPKEPKIPKEPETPRITGIPVNGAEAAKIKQKYYTIYPDGVTSSGHLKGKDESYEPENMIDHVPTTWWTPNPHRDGKGAFIQINFETPKSIGGCEIWAGSHQPNYPKYGNIFKLNNRAKLGRLEFSDGTIHHFELQDVDDWQALLFPPVMTSYIRLRVDDVYPGEKWNDLCISEFKALSNEAQYGMSSEEGAAKPVIYLYPEQETIVNVQLDFAGKLHTTYPEYPKQGWQVIASPDGKLIDTKDGHEYSYLFWDGFWEVDWKIEEGFVVKGADTKAFLQKTLADMGMQPKEYNEFIVFWLPLLQNNAYNLIHFSQAQYEALAKLKVQPEPESVLRVFMVWKGLEKPIEIPKQTFKTFERKGFTLVEWGGTEIGHKMGLIH
jgi:hypothetical protein